MCASYGIGGRFGGGTLPFDLPPLSEPHNVARLNEWAAARGGNARITGRKAVNLNPIIHAFSSSAGAGSRTAAGDRELAFAWWWLWLDGSGPVKFSAFNSRADRLLRSWRTPFQRRALLPATWFVEKGERFGLPDNELFAIAAITSSVVPDGPVVGEPADGDALLTYSMVTRGAVGAVSAVHDRMPLVLPCSMHDEWLDPERPGDEELVSRVRLVSEEISQALTAVAGAGAGADSRSTTQSDTSPDPDKLF